MIKQYRIDRTSHTEYTVTCVFENGEDCKQTIRTFDNGTYALECAIGRAGKMSLIMHRPVRVVLADGRIYSFNARQVTGDSASTSSASNTKNLSDPVI